jgi:hypothetical protein
MENPFGVLTISAAILAALSCFAHAEQRVAFPSGSASAGYTDMRGETENSFKTLKVSALSQATTVKLLSIPRNSMGQAPINVSKPQPCNNITCGDYAVIGIGF